MHPGKEPLEAVLPISVIKLARFGPVPSRLWPANRPMSLIAQMLLDPVAEVAEGPTIPAVLPPRGLSRTTDTATATDLAGSPSKEQRGNGKRPGQEFGEREQRPSRASRSSPLFSRMIHALLDPTSGDHTREFLAERPMIA